MVRRLRAAPSRLGADGARRGRRGLAPPHRHRDVHRHRGLHAAGRGSARAGNGRPAQPSLRPARHLHRERRGRDRQVYRRLRDGGVGWPVDHGGPCRSRGPRRPRDGSRRARGQSPARRRRADAGPHAHRAAFGPGHRGQHRRTRPGQLHRGRRHRERGAALRAAREGIHEERRGRDRAGERRHDRGDEAS